MAFCTKCGALLEEGSGICGKCGGKAEQKAQEARCGFCGNLIKEGLHYCSYCGADLSESPPAKRDAPAVRGGTQASKMPQPPDTSPAAPSGPERELYRRGMVSWINGMVSPIGTLAISTHRLRFTPGKLYLTAKPLEVPVEQITEAHTANTMLAIPGGMQVHTASGTVYTFGFGAVNAGEADRAVQAIRQASGHPG